VVGEPPSAERVDLLSRAGRGGARRPPTGPPSPPRGGRARGGGARWPGRDRPVLGACRDRPVLTETRASGSSTPSTGATSARRRAVTCCARPRSCRPAQPARLRPLPHPSAFAVADGARQATKLLARHVAEGNRFPSRWRCALGHGQPEDRGRPDRPGDGADGPPAPASTPTAASAAPR
jgi:hypothetical protein